jgi:hypothetical protein
MKNGTYTLKYSGINSLLVFNPTNYPDFLLYLYIIESCIEQKKQKKDIKFVF